eukprot:g2027.t1
MPRDTSRTLLVLLGAATLSGAHGGATNSYVGVGGTWLNSPDDWSLDHFPKYPEVAKVQNVEVKVVGTAAGVGKDVIITSDLVIGGELIVGPNECDPTTQIQVAEPTYEQDVQCRCASDHFHPVDNGRRCEQNECYCENGVEHGGEQCHTHDAHLCDQCHEGFHREGDECKENVCKCANGDGRKGVACAKHDEEVCVADSCAAGHYFQDQSELLKTCTPCAAGSVAASKGSVTCEPCEAGRYQPEEGQAACFFCQKGRYHSNGGAAECLKCQPGRFADGMGHATCAACSVGTFAPNAEQQSCFMCQHGKYAEDIGASSCDECDYECPAGKIKTNCGNKYENMKLTSSEGTCSWCELGRFKAEAGPALECTPHRPACNTDQYQAVKPNRVRDRVCIDHIDECGPTEWEVTAPGPHNQRVCRALTMCTPTQWRSKAETYTSDRVCTNHTVCPAGKRELTVGTYTADRTCGWCPEGTHKSVVGNHRECVACPVGYRSRGHRRSCEAFVCTHTTCRKEDHQCHWSKSHAQRWGYKFAYTHTDTNCDAGETFHSIRVSHSESMCTWPTQRNPTNDHLPCGKRGDVDLLEVSCKHGHKCAMGAVTGDKNQCECAPLKPVDFAAEMAAP